jgi:hypothetical protein
MHFSDSDPGIRFARGVGMPVIIKSTPETTADGFPDMLTRFLPPVAGVAWRFHHTVLGVFAGPCCARFASLYS